jgi:hypothetical protein
VHDHDYPYLAEGSIVSFGIYNLKKNQGFLGIGKSYETSEMVKDTLLQWWRIEGKKDYGNGDSLLLLADSGGSTSYRSWRLKVELQELANVLKIEIRVAHYPPYTSKWNPIEHRLFPHISRSLKGVIFKSYEMFKGLVEKTTTKMGLTVKAKVFEKFYEKGKKVTSEEKASLNIIHDPVLPQLNYRILPNNNT